MTRYEKTMALKPEDFKQLIGVKHETFEAMLEILVEAYAKKHKKRRQAFKIATVRPTVYDVKILAAICNSKGTGI